MITTTLGDARITVINAGDMRADLSVWMCVPPNQAPPEYASLFAQPLALPMQNVHIRLGDASVLVDASRWGFDDQSIFRLPGYTPPPPLLDQLRSVGIAPESITHVVLTHAHFDHFNGLCGWPDAPALAFPNAFHHLGRADWAGDEVQRDVGNADTLIAASFGALMTAGLLMRSHGDLQIAPGISIHAAPGETPGHQIVRVHSHGETLYCLGDLLHHPVELERPDWQVFWCDPEVNTRSRARVLGAAEQERARLVATHIPGIGSLSAGRWQPESSRPC
jgi:glyoxylase-like metal-dependent hydrolase (beta-lactamase superfamily II)